MARNQAPIHHPFPRAGASLLRRGGMARRWPIIAILACAIIGLAWFDGGEEPIRPITQTIELPEAGR